jgi:hypothetical protein
MGERLVFGLTLASHGLAIVGQTLSLVELQAEVDAVAAAAVALAAPGETLSGVIPAEPEQGSRVYLCAFEGEGDGSSRTWVALDSDGRPLRDRRLVRAAVSIAALCELAEEAAGGGKLEELRAQLLSLRLTERPEGIEEAEEAALELERTIGSPPRLAEPAYLDRVGAAARRLELALGPSAGSPFAEAMKQGTAAVDELVRDVETHYRSTLD